MVEPTRARSQLRDRLLFGVLYTGFFALVFVLAAYWTFPYDRLRDFLAAKLSTTDGTSTRSVEIGELSPVGIGGVRVRDLEITQTSTAPDTTPSTLKLPEATASVSLFSLLLGDRKISLEAKAGNGTITARYLQNSSEQHIEAELAALDIGALGLGSLLSLPVKGKASGTIDLRMPGEVTKSTGAVKLEIQGLHIGDGKAKIKPPGMGAGTGLTLDEIDAGKLSAALDMRDGVANITRFTTDGKDLKLAAKGKVHLADPLKRSRPDLDLDLTFTDAYKNKSDRTKAMFEIVGMQWQHATTPDGTMRVHVGGTFLALRSSPGR
jgi:type II secretion system protein N